MEQEDVIAISVTKATQVVQLVQDAQEVIAPHSSEDLEKVCKSIKVLDVRSSTLSSEVRKKVYYACTQQSLGLGRLSGPHAHTVIQNCSGPISSIMLKEPCKSIAHRRHAGWILPAGCWLLVLAAVLGCWLLTDGCWLLDAGSWLLDAGC